MNEILCRLRFAAQAVCVPINQIDMVSVQPIKSVGLSYGWALGWCFVRRGRACLAQSLGAWLRPVKQSTGSVWLQARSVWFIWSIWSVRSVLFVWLNKTNQIDQMNQTDEIDQMDQTDQMNKTGQRTF